MRFVLLLITVLVVGLLAKKQLETTVTVPSTVVVPNLSGGAPAKAVPVTELPKAVQAEVSKAMREAGESAEQKLKDAESK